MIYRNICNISHTFRINGNIVGSFRSFRRVRQGDPLSPLLFVLAQQVLSTNIKACIQQGRLIPYKIFRSHIDFMLTTSWYLLMGRRGRLTDLWNYFGCINNPPVKQLGIPLFLGRSRAIYFEFLLAKIRRVLDGWKAKLLSSGGKVTSYQIKSVLCSIPIYSLQVEF